MKIGKGPETRGDRNPSPRTKARTGRRNRAPNGHGPGGGAEGVGEALGGPQHVTADNRRRVEPGNPAPRVRAALRGSADRYRHRVCVPAQIPRGLSRDFHHRLGAVHALASFPFVGVDPRVRGGSRARDSMGSQVQALVAPRAGKPPALSAWSWFSRVDPRVRRGRPRGSAGGRRCGW